MLFYCGLSENYSVHNNLVCGENALVEEAGVLDSLTWRLSLLHTMPQVEFNEWTNKGTHVKKRETFRVLLVALCENCGHSLRLLNSEINLHSIDICDSICLVFDHL